MRATLPVVVLGLALVRLTTGASAESALTPEDIVTHFAGPQNYPIERGICIGTAAECGEAAPAPANLDTPTTLNLTSTPPETTPETADQLKTTTVAAAANVPASLDMLIAFDFDSAELTAEARSNLEAFAQALKDPRLEGASFVVEGHTDASGSKAYNKALSERRAASVRRFLLASGVPDQKIASAGLGQESPRMDDPYHPGNRRVEMRMEPR